MNAARRFCRRRAEQVRDASVCTDTAADCTQPAELPCCRRQQANASGAGATRAKSHPPTTQEFCDQVQRCQRTHGPRSVRDRAPSAGSDGSRRRIFFTCIVLTFRRSLLTRHRTLFSARWETPHGRALSSWRHVRSTHRGRYGCSAAAWRHNASRRLFSWRPQVLPSVSDPHRPFSRARCHSGNVNDPTTTLQIDEFQRRRQLQADKPGVAYGRLRQNERTQRR
jgi:hypothetical protein